jgi:RNA polymerase sigma-70 factor, ECF subfamily
MTMSAHSQALVPAEMASPAETSTFAAGNSASRADQLLVSRTRAGDVEAFALLLGRHEQTLLRLARRFVRDEHDAEEILQDVFMTTWTKLSGFEDRAQIGSWLYRVTVNASLMHLRARKRRPRTVDSVGETTAREAPNTLCTSPCDPRLRPDEQLESLELRRVIQHLVDRLPASVRSVFDLREVQGWSTRQTARLLGISEAAVKTRLHRARHTLRRQIGEYQVQ